MKTSFTRSAAITVVCVVLGVLIALQMKNVNATKLTENNLMEIQTRLLDYAQKNQELSQRNANLNLYISQLESSLKADNSAVDAIIKEKERYAVFAGLTEVTGPGLKVTIVCNSDTQIRDSILRQYVNELRALGAQAISINQERMVAMSEIRVSGGSIIINGNSYGRQGVFEIKAIADPKKNDYFRPYLNGITDSILADAAARGDQFEIDYEFTGEITLPALSEDSIAFRLDLLNAVK
ncbi:MAG: DUF881 domain-containing protein [Saccharofermentanales bacterium]|jgi:uncharacterized protein YlxW (UPF0749 family)